MGNKNAAIAAFFICTFILLLIMRHLTIITLLLLSGSLNAQSIKSKYDCALFELVLKDSTIRKHFYIDKRIKPITFYNEGSSFIGCPVVKVNGKNYEIYCEEDRYRRGHSSDTSYFVLNIKDNIQNKFDVMLYESSSGHYALMHLIKRGQEYNVLDVEYSILGD